MNGQAKRAAVYIRQDLTDAQDFETLLLNNERYEKRIRDMGGVEAGTYVDSRRGKETPSLASLMEDCRAGKIDMILTRSVSRFGRDVLKILEITRELKSLGVGLYFETEGLASDAENFETILAALAEAAETRQLTIDKGQLTVKKHNAKGTVQI
jgi:DNA invertase Pin-like site-specific DNA recombinase